ncbi:MAG: hypothetical protein BWX86_02549 [Verrucomicrobia bacterium ADurb.Bin122]|nr:MAG: hypothetical protein BWX86_02549 [Verrucomicrobia bacterium ADurb.Bin122]
MPGDQRLQLARRRRGDRLPELAILLRRKRAGLDPFLDFDGPRRDAEGLGLRFTRRTEAPQILAQDTQRERVEHEVMPGEYEETFARLLCEGRAKRPAHRRIKTNGDLLETLAHQRRQRHAGVEGARLEREPLRLGEDHGASRRESQAERLEAGRQAAQPRLDLRLRHFGPELQRQEHMERLPVLRMPGDELGLQRQQRQRLPRRRCGKVGTGGCARRRIRLQETAEIGKRGSAEKIRRAKRLDAVSMENAGDLDGLDRVATGPEELAVCAGLGAQNLVPRLRQHLRPVTWGRRAARVGQEPAQLRKQRVAVRDEKRVVLQHEPRGRARLEGEAGGELAGLEPHFHGPHGKARLVDFGDSRVRRQHVGRDAVDAVAAVRQRLLELLRGLADQNRSGRTLALGQA